MINLNFGSKAWIRKETEIVHMVNEYKPDIAIISESNLQFTDEDHLVNIPGHKIETTIDFRLIGSKQIHSLNQE